jgi:NAD(P)-dependent dehydrogenase (short-subunit alcohol dehydrogenase family)
MAAMAVICITGSSVGIGLATARVLVAHGHRVLIHARSRDRGRPALEELGGDTTLVCHIVRGHPRLLLHRGRSSRLSTTYR